MSHAAGEWTARLALDPTAWVAPGAVVVGQVRLGARASVWFNTVVRGDTDRIEIGDDTNVQDNSTVHVDAGQPALVGARVTIGHRAIIHGCVIEDDCLIGMGAIVLSGARVGAGSLLGAGALVREGQSLPPGSLAVGAPARVVGPVADAHRAAIRRGAEHYVELSRSYLARGFVRPHPPRASDMGATSAARPPMSWLEWGQSIATLSESPVWAAGRLERVGVEAWRRAPAPGRWSALDVTAHLLAADREVFVPRLERLLAEDAPALPDVSVARSAAEPGADATRVLAEWSRLRRGLVARLAPLGPEEWRRHGLHSLRGPYAVSDLVRAVVEHDLSHRRQIAAALGAAA